ncbi:MAG: endonuclease MutS2 [Armatimonadetes bacterium]|nr:endonuclease MutS2 [Armatimonadota bacterium]
MHALRVLEFDQILRQLADHCDTSVGASLALSLQPKFTEEEVDFELGRTRESETLLGEVGLNFVGLHDVESAVKLAQRGAVADGASLFKVGESLRTMRLAEEALSPRSDALPLLWQLGVLLPAIPKVEGRLLASLDGDGTVRDEASPELAELRQKKARGAKKIVDRIQSYVSGRSREYLSDGVFTQRDGRYVIPLKSEHKGKIKGIVHDTSASGATLFLEPEDVVTLGNELRQLEAAEKALEERILRELSEHVGAHAEAIVDGVQAASTLDFVLAKARLGESMGGCVPGRIKGPELRLKDARHPLLDRSVCVPLTVTVGGDVEVFLITGPNTGGKTVAIKTVGLAVAMAQSGLMPPAESAHIGCFSQIWADIGDEQSLQQSLSTFSGHIKNVAAALNALTPGALVLLDEVGAGTDPGEGAALARAILLGFQRGKAIVMASTHFGELKVLASNAPGFMNASMEFDLKSLSPTYRLLVGVPGSSHALKIAERYGVPQAVVEEAGAAKSEGELDIAATIEKLQESQRQAQRAQSEADRLSSRLRQVEAEAQRKIDQAEEARRTVRERASSELETLLREIRIEAMDIFEEVKKDPSQRGIDKARERLKTLQEIGREFVEETKPKRAEAPKAPHGQVTKGATVRIAGLSQTGTVLDEPKNGQVQVQAGPLKMTCKLTDLTVIARENKQPQRSRTGAISLKKAMSASTEIHLRQMRAEDAEQELTRFLDESVLAGLDSVRIVHGKGEGILRKTTQDILRRHRDVKSFREGEPEEGGAGVTIAVFK